MCRRGLVAALVVVSAACGGSDDSSSDTPGVATCTDTTTFAMAGAFELAASSVSTVTVADRVVGISGSTQGRVITFTVRRPATDNLDAVGSYDAATINIKYLQTTVGSDCAMAGACDGFFALAGTIVVEETTPRFRATFELTDLYEHDDTSDELGPALPGSVNACIDVTR